MRIALVTGVSLFMSTAGLCADSTDYMLNQIAEVLAISAICPILKHNSPLIGAAAVSRGFEAADITAGGRFYDELRALVLQKQEKLAGFTEAGICATGVLLYGKTGINAANLLIVE